MFDLKDVFAIIISLAALVTSAITMWLTLFRRGSLRMTRPSVIYFGPDSGERRFSKVYLRALIYSTAKRGILIETLFVRIKRGETQQNFNVWVYGDERLARGSGLFAGQEGIVNNHHFMLPKGTNFDLIAGDYELEVYARIVQSNAPLLLFKIMLPVSEGQVSQLKDYDRGIFFDWGSDAGKYQSHVDSRPVPTPRQGGEQPPDPVLTMMTELMRNRPKEQ